MVVVKMVNLMVATTIPFGEVVSELKQNSWNRDIFCESTTGSLEEASDEGLDDSGKEMDELTECAWGMNFGIFS